MKILFSIFTAVFFVNVRVHAGVNQLAGRWLYVGFIYHGQTYPPLDSDLNLYFEFTEDGRSKLEWSFKNSTSMCSRWALYENDAALIDQWVVWTDPQNAADCFKDPDMKIGSRSQTPYFIKDSRLYLELSLDGDPLFYILTKGTNNVFNGYFN